MELLHLLEVVLHGRAAPILDPRACCYWLLFALSHHRLPRQLLRPQQLQRRQLPPLRQLLPLCPQHRQEDQEECGIRPGYRVSVCLQIGAGLTRVYAFLCLHLWESAHKKLKKLLQNKITVWPCDHVLVIVKICVCSVFPNSGWDLFNVRLTFCLQGLHSSPAMSAKSSRQAGMEWCGWSLSSCRRKTIVMLKHCNHTSSNAKLDGVCSQARDGTDFPLPFFLGKPRALQCPTSTYRTV